MEAATEQAGSGVRLRKQVAGDVKETAPAANDKARIDAATTPTKGRGKSAGLEPNSYWLTRIVFLRSLAFVYCEYVGVSD